MQATDGQARRQDGHDRPLNVVSHVPGEICFVVSDRSFNQDRYPTEADVSAYAERLYGRVSHLMNDLIEPLTPLPEGRGPLERDLTPSDGFIDYLRTGRTKAGTPAAQHARPNADAAGPRPFRSLADDGRRLAGSKLVRPWLVLPREREATVLCFYSILPADATEAERADAEHQLRLKELVKLLNWKHLPRTDLHWPGLTVRAATPNWMTGAQHIGGSPGTLPQRIVPAGLPALTRHRQGRFTFTFVEDGLREQAEAAEFGCDSPAVQRFLKQQQLDNLVARLRCPPEPGEAPNVVVAILDTSPAADTIVARAAECRPNSLLESVADHLGRDDGAVRIDDLSLDEDAFGHVATLLPNWRDRLRGAHEFAIPDHGLFVAGIIHDIAPRAKVRLHRVLNDHGIGDVSALVSLLQALPGRIEREEPVGTRLIINLSLVIDIPPADALLESWFPLTFKDCDALRRSWKQLAAMLNLTHLCLEEVIDWLWERNVLLVGAAGNAGFAPPTRPEPLYPAAYDQVLSVASVTRTEVLPAQYSNRGDMRIFGNGVAVFGGQGQARNQGEMPVIPPATGTDGWRDAVAGIFTAKTIPLAPTAEAENTSGWVWWSGTSFATPVIAAIAANLLLDPPTSQLSVPAVMRTIRGFATKAESALEVAGPFDCSAIYARQIWRA